MVTIQMWLNDTSRKYFKTGCHVCTDHCCLKSEMFCVYFWCFFFLLSFNFICSLRPLKRWLHAHVLQLSRTLYMVNTVDTINNMFCDLNLTFLSICECHCCLFFHAVITLRCMVQFIGREAKYWSVIFFSGISRFLLCITNFIFYLYIFFFCSSSGVFDSIVTIYREEGILGFFA